MGELAHVLCHSFTCSASWARFLSPTQLLGLVAQCCNPATGGQGYGMKLVTQVSITWLSLKCLVAASVLEAEWSWPRILLPVL